MNTDLVIKVALADDHKIFRDGIKMALKGKEYLKLLWEAEDGRDLMHKMKMKKPDVLLMDIRMPEMDGFQFLDELKNLPKDPLKYLNVFMLTSSLDQKDIVRSREYPMVKGFLSKPLDMLTVKDILSRTEIK